jgi:hypothetical protein
VVGGNGYAAATLQDLGIEPTMGATGTAKPKRKLKKTLLSLHLLVVESLHVVK